MNSQQVARLVVPMLGGLLPKSKSSRASLSAIRAYVFLAGLAILAGRTGAGLELGKRGLQSLGSRAACRVIQQYQVAFEELDGVTSAVLAHLRPDDLGTLASALEHIVAFHQEGDDLLAWIYQGLKKRHSDEVFNNVLQGSEKLQGQRLLFATQFFTDRYMVDFLVARSLSLIPAAKRRDVTVLDPAVGGGNFLVSAFDHILSSTRSAERHTTARDLLTRRLVGFDLDPCMVELARQTLALRGQRELGDVVSPVHNIRAYQGRHGFLEKEHGHFSEMVSCANPSRGVTVLLTNPPFAGPRDLAASVRDYLRAHFPDSNGDVCVAFMARGLSLLRDGDVAGFVSQRSWMYLSTFEPFRRRVLTEEWLAHCVDLGSGAFELISGEKATVCLPIFAKVAPRPNSCRMYRIHDKATSTKAAILSDENDLLSRTSIIDQAELLKAHGAVVQYPTLAAALVRDVTSTRYREFAIPMQGTSTGDHRAFIDVAWKHVGDPVWRPVSKGGGYCKWLGLNHLSIKWGRSGEYIKQHPGSALRNLDYLDQTKLVYSDTGTSGLSARLLCPNQVPVASGPGIRLRMGDEFAHLAFLNSRVSTFFLRHLSPKLTVSAGYIGQLPAHWSIFEDARLARLAKECIELKIKALRNRPNQPEFLANSTFSSLEELAVQRHEEQLSAEFTRLELEAEIELLVANHLALSKQTLHDIMSTLGAPAAWFRGEGVLPANAVADVITRTTSAAEFRSMRPRNGTMGCEGPIEYLACSYGVSIRTAKEALLEELWRRGDYTKIFIEDALHVIVLSILGYGGPTQWTTTAMSIDDMVASICSKCGDAVDSLQSHGLAGTLPDWLRRRLPVIHGDAFLGRPLVFVDSRKLALS